MVSEDIDPDEANKAATKIQAAFRGKKERQQSASSSSAIIVGLRMRPFVPADYITTVSSSSRKTLSSGKDQVPCFIFRDNLVSVCKESQLDEKSKSEGPWKFDLAMDSSDSSKETFVDNDKCYQLMGRRMIDDVLNGFNTCLFCYGQTGTGKTTTIMGDPQNGPGLLRRLLDDVFIEANKMKQSGANVTIELQMLEVYNEELNDLLLDKGAPKQKLVPRILPAGVTIQGAATKLVQNANEVQKFIDFGNGNRVVAATAMNPQSSRGHTVVRLMLTKSGGEDGSVLKSEIYFADLAGHENIKTTQVTGDRLKELSFINGSLMWLQTALHGMATSKSKSGKVDFFQFRNSKLTLLLSNALTGNSRTSVIVTLSPSTIHFETSLSSIKFAVEVKGIKMTVTSSAGIDPQVLIRKLQKENDELRSQLAAASAGTIPSALTDSDECAQLRATVAELEEKLRSSGASSTRVVEDDALKAKVAELEAKLASRDYKKIVELEAKLASKSREEEDLRRQLAQLRSPSLEGSKNISDMSLSISYSDFRIPSEIMDQMHRALELSRQNVAELSNILQATRKSSLAIT